MLILLQHTTCQRISKLRTYQTKDTTPHLQGVGFHYFKAEEMPQLRITWYITEPGDELDKLAAAGMETLSFVVYNRLNPADNQEYTKPGLHILNSGANLKWNIGSPDGLQDSKSTPSCYVMAGDTLGAIVGVVTNGSGNPVPGVVVELWEPGGLAPIDTATIDKHGFYYFPKVAPDNYEVKYGGTTESVTVTGGNIETVNFP